MVILKLLLLNKCVISCAFSFDGLTVSPPPIDAPADLVINDDLQLPLNATLSLACNYTAFPTPTAEWFFNGSLLNVTHPRISQTVSDTTSVLTLTDLTRDEGGNYSCVVTNTQGSDSGMTTLLILSESKSGVCFGKKKTTPAYSKHFSLNCND